MLHQSTIELENKLRIVSADSEDSEAGRWSKTRGLGDVSTVLAPSLAMLDHSVSLIVTYFRPTKFARNDAHANYGSGIQSKVLIRLKRVSDKLFRTTRANPVVDTNPRTLGESTFTGIMVEAYDARSLRFAMAGCSERY